MRGGPRKGAGRPRGAATKRSRKIADREAENGLTPLEVMLKAMRKHVEKDEWDAAASLAKDAAPYMHPKLASTQHTGPGGGPIQTVDLSKLTEAQIDALEALYGPLSVAGGDDEGDQAGTGQA